jgi:DNA-binding FrmR family transcriptional regulator
MIEPYKSKAVTGCKKAVGQLKKVLQMIEENKYCMDLLQQIRAVQGLLNSVSVQVLESHLHTCGKKAFATNDTNKHQQVIDELIIAFKASKK